MTRLLILSSEFPPGPGGIGTHACQVAGYFSHLGWEVRVVSPQDYADEDEIEGFNAQLPFAVTRLPSCRMKLWQSIQRFNVWLRTLHDFQPDLVLASGARAIILSALVLNLARIPWVVVGHGSEFGIKKGWGAWITRVSSNQASAVICVSHFTRNAMRQLKITKPPCFVIHNGADQTQFFPIPHKITQAFRKAQGVGGNFVLLTVGNVSDRKGQEVVIRALPRIQQKHPAIQYWMAGLPQKQAALQALAEDLGVSDQIRFWGRTSQEALLTLYNACDLFVMTSRQLEDGDFEGFGIAVIEAALCGKAAVASDNSGLAEAVLDGETGLLVPQDAPEETARVLLSLIQNPPRLARMNQAAYQHALQHQTWAKVGHRYQKVLEEVLARRV